MKLSVSPCNIAWKQLKLFHAAWCGGGTEESCSQCSLTVWQQTLLHLLPDGSRLNKQCTGRGLSSTTGLYVDTVQVPLFWAILITHYRVFLHLCFSCSSFWCIIACVSPSVSSTSFVPVPVPHTSCILFVPVLLAVACSLSSVCLSQFFPWTFLCFPSVFRFFWILTFGLWIVCFKFSLSASLCVCIWVLTILQIVTIIIL